MQKLTDELIQSAAAAGPDGTVRVSARLLSDAAKAIDRMDAELIACTDVLYDIEKQAKRIQITSARQRHP